MYDDFNKDLERGKRGEKLFEETLTAIGHTVIDLRDNAEARSKDIDFRVLLKNGNVATVEVKTDDKSQYTGNLFIEYANTNNISHNYMGWYKYCEADFYTFVQIEKRKAHLVSRDELENLIKTNKFRTASSYNACGFLVPLNNITTLESYHCFNM